MGRSCGQMGSIGVTFYGRVDGEGQILLDQAAFTACRQDLIGKPVELRLQRERRRRDPQLNYYWAVVLRAFAEKLKRDPDDVHEALRRKLVDCEEVGPLAFPRSTAAMEKPEFSRYLDQVLELAGRMGIAIDGPVPAAVRRAS